MVDVRSARKSSLSDVVSVMGRERLMCSGRGAPRSLVRKVVMSDLVLFCRDERSLVRRVCVSVGGCHSM